MKIIDNAKKHDLPPRYALYDALSDTLYLYTDFGRGLAIGLRAAWRRGRTDSDLAVLSHEGSVWEAYPRTQMLYKGSLAPVIQELIFYCVPTEDDTTEDDTTEDDTTEDDTTEDDTTACNPYRCKVSCAGDPATAAWCVVFFAGGQSYIRAYQSRGRAASAFHRYHIGRASSAFLLYRGLDTWHMVSCVVDRSLWDSVPYSETGLLVDRAVSLANKHF